MPPYVAALRKAYARGAVEVVTLELIADGQAWREMLDSGQWRQVPLLRSVLPVVDGALLRPIGWQRALEERGEVPDAVLDVSPEHWALTERAAAVEQLTGVLAQGGAQLRPQAVEVARQLARDQLALLAPWDGARLLWSHRAWCGFFMDEAWDYSLMVLGPEGAVTMMCATEGDAVQIGP